MHNFLFFPQTMHVEKEGSKKMGSEKSRNNQFKENENSGEQRNGRKSPYKNHNERGGVPNEYVSKREQ